MERARRMHDERWRLPREALVDKDLGARRVVDRHQRDVVEIVRFPEFGRDPNVVRTFPRSKLIAANLDPILGLTDSGCLLRIDPKAKRRSPDEIRDKPHRSPIEGKEERARAFQSLFRGEHLIRLGVELNLKRSVGPDDTRNIGLAAVAQAEMKYWAAHDLLLNEQTRPYFDLAAQAE